MANAMDIELVDHDVGTGIRYRSDSDGTGPARRDFASSGERRFLTPGELTVALPLCV